MADTIRKQTYPIAIAPGGKGPPWGEGYVIGGFGLYMEPNIYGTWAVDHLATGRHVADFRLLDAWRWIKRANAMQPETLRLNPDDPRFQELRGLAWELAVEWDRPRASDETLREYAAAWDDLAALREAALA